MSTQSYEVVPGDSVGEIVLGAPLIVVVRQLKDTPQFGVIHVSYGPNPHMQPITLTASRRNMDFEFHRITHLLESISITDMTSTELVYRSQILAGPSRSTTFAHVYSVLGPTFQGSMNAETGLYTLKYPGIEVEFLIPAKFHAEFCDRGTHPTKLPDGTIPVAKRIKVLLSPNSSTRLQRDVSYAKGRVIAGDLVSFDWTQQTLVFQGSKVSLSFGTSPQELIHQLGCSPHRVFNLVENKMGIHHQHVGSAKSSLERRAPLYSFNYPLLGVDFIFGGDHRLEKVMLHNPLPSHETFLRYQRCNYTLTCPWNLGPGVETEGDGGVGLNDAREMDNGFLWTEQEDAHAAACSVRPLISSTGCSNGLVLKIYAFSGIAIYVMPSTRRVVKILLFGRRLPPPKHRAPMLPPPQANDNSSSYPTGGSSRASAASGSGPFVASEVVEEQEDCYPTAQDLHSPMKRADTSAPPPKFVDPFPAECSDGVGQADIPPSKESDAEDEGVAPHNPWASGAPVLEAATTLAEMAPVETTAFEDNVVEEADCGGQQNLLEFDDARAVEAAGEEEEAADEEEVMDEDADEEAAVEQEAEEVVAEEEEEGDAPANDDDEAVEAEEGEEAAEEEAAEEEEPAGDEADDREEDTTDESETPPSFSVPPPLVSLVDNGQRQESGERYEDDFEESTSRHFSLKSSSYAPSANLSPTVPTAQTTTEEISNDRWPTLPGAPAATHSDAGEGQQPQSPPDGETPVIDTESPDVEESSGPTSAANSKTTSPPNGGLTFANQSTASTSSNQKSKKHKKKKR